MITTMQTYMSKMELPSKINHLAIVLALAVSIGSVVMPLASVAATTQTEEFTEGDAFIVPAGVTEITVEVWGGGGAGGGSTRAGGGSARGGAGGGGGAYASSVLTVEPGQELQVVIGTGGAGVIEDDGNPGSPSFVGLDTDPDNALVRAAGGSAGTGNTAGGDPRGGAGGTAEDSIGQIRIAGANGEDGDTARGCRSGAGGESAYQGGGDGGAAVTSGNQDGNPGNAPGGGGAGARTQGNGGSHTGGAGAVGKVVIAWVTYDLTISSTIGGSVTTPGEGAFAFGDEAMVNLLAVTSEAYRFEEWTGDVGTVADVYAASTTITMNGNYSITANFQEIPPVQHNLTISRTEGGSVMEPGEGLIICDEGAVVDLVAEADEGWQFLEWTGDIGSIADVHAAVTTITMNGDYSITANFEAVSTPSVYPTVTTQAATDISPTSATLNMQYSMGNCTSAQVRFAYKKSTDSYWSYTNWASKTADGTHAELVTELNSNTEYEFAAQLKYNDTLEGSVLQFTTATSFTPLSGGGCFIATAAYGTSIARQIDVLREFRDVVLLESTTGSQFVALYYRLSPPVADFISANSFLRTLVRELVVDPIVWVVEATKATWQI